MGKLIPNKKVRTVADWLHAQEYHDKMVAQGIPIPHVFIMELEDLRKQFGPPIPSEREQKRKARKDAFEAGRRMGKPMQLLAYAQFLRDKLIPLGNAEDFKDAREPAIGFGDYVVLNSGGCAMLVLEQPRNGSAVCGWRDSQGNVREEIFNIACISRIDVLAHLPSFIVPPSYNK